MDTNIIIVLQMGVWENWCNVFAQNIFFSFFQQLKQDK